LLSQPIQISLSLVEVILTAKSKQQFLESKAAHSKTEGNSNLKRDDHHKAATPPSSDPTAVPRWLQSYVNKVLGNISVNLENIVFKYQHGDVLLAASLGKASLFSADKDNSWIAAFQEPTGPLSHISKVFQVSDFGIDLDWYEKRSDGKQKRIMEDPILSRTSFNARARLSLSADRGMDESNEDDGNPMRTPQKNGSGTKSKDRSLHSGGKTLLRRRNSKSFSDDLGSSGAEKLKPKEDQDPFSYGTSLTLLSDVVVVDIHIPHLNFYLTDHQFQLLLTLGTLPLTSGVAHKEKFRAPPSPATSPMLAPTAIPDVESTSKNPAPGNLSWLGWAASAIVGGGEEGGGKGDATSVIDPFEKALISSTSHYIEEIASHNVQETWIEELLHVVNVNLEGASLTLVRLSEHGHDDPPIGATPSSPTSPSIISVPVPLSVDPSGMMQINVNESSSRLRSPTGSKKLFKEHILTLTIHTSTMQASFVKNPCLVNPTVYISTHSLY
jgi:hypothetical protein